MYNSILYESNDNVARITLNRPDVFNAFNNEQSFELQDALKKSGKDEQVRVVVITGAGKAFCSGQDLKDISDQKQRSLSESLYKRYNPIIRLIRNMDKPVICRMNGVAAGAGCSLALACDMVIASDQSSMIEVFIHVGLVLDSGSSYFLPRLVGTQKAFELATMGSKIKAGEALKLGLVNKVVPHDELDQAVDEVAAFYANAPTKAVGMIKKMLNKSTYSDLETMLEYEAFCQEIAGRTSDYQEGVKAFMEKRKAEFRGH